MPADHRRPPGDAIAIVGIGGIFAASESPERLWDLVRTGTDATRDVPAGRWLLDPSDALDPRIAEPDRVYTARGGFVGPAQFDPTGTALDPTMVERLDPAFHLALIASAQAWRIAKTGPVDLSRAGVIFGHIVLPTETASALSLDVLGRTFTERLGMPTRPPADFEPRNAFPAGLPAAIVARAFGLGGVAYTLDAACASSLYALKLAVDELLSGRADLMIAGGVSRPDALYTQMGFSQLRALSPRGRAAPLDQSADGLIVGEGAGMFVLKRLEDALRHGDDVYGLIAGIGLSNDVAGDLMAPDSDGQLRAMRSAYEQAGWIPPDVDLIECHATGTPRGDAVELASLRRLWGDSGWRAGQCAIGSHKANIGHSLTAAGAAGLLKLLLALKHRTLPPSANLERPNPSLGLDSGPFRVLSRPEPWPSRSPGTPRRAAISGFGFGGINAHLLIEEFIPASRPRSVPRPATVEIEPIAIVGLAAQVGTLGGSEALGGILLGERASDGRLRSLELPVGRFRIPPRELGEMLPQQSLMLRVAAEAVEASSWDARLAPRTAVLVGIGLDLNTTNFYLRWSMTDRAREWAPDLAPDERAAWTEALRESAGPALSANRTMGSLGGVVASRIARALRIGGPSFTVSCDETSGIRAMAVAVDWLRCGEVDAAIVGAVDFAADDRAALARRRLGSQHTEGTDSAYALVLKRHADAVRDGDRVVALIRDLDTGATEDRPEIGGGGGAATGLAQVVRSAAGLHDAIRPATNRPARPWLRDRDDGPRRARVETGSLGGRTARVLLEGPPASTERVPRLASPAVLRRSGLFALEGDDVAAIRELEALSRDHADEPIDALARRWWRRHPGDSRRTLGLAIVADGVANLWEQLARADRSASGRRAEPRGVAFVYPGLGSDFEGMGRELGLLWPEVLRRQGEENRTLRDQFSPEVWWDGKLPSAWTDHRVPILGQVAVGSLVTDILLHLGIAPDAAIGYSMGESAALVALRAWTDRDTLAHRLLSSPLFASELSGPCEAARRAWGLPPDRPVEWVAGIVPRSSEDVRKAIEARGRGRVYILIRNTPDETVIGGDRPAVRDVVTSLHCPFLELPAVSTVHCEIGRLVEREYEALHEIETSAPPGIAFYSGVAGRRYDVDRRSAARAIAAQASQPIDFTGTIEAAHADGIGLFIEVGPGRSCTRLIDHILGDRPHVAVAACRPDRDSFAAVLDVLAACINHRLPVDLSRLYGGVEEDREPRTAATIRVAVGPPEFAPPPRPGSPIHQNPTADKSMKPLPNPATATLAAAILDADRARAEAHRAFLRVAQGAADLMARQLGSLEPVGWVQPTDASPPAVQEFGRTPEPTALFDRRQCLALAIGQVADVFGPDFAEVDRLPTRVRLPDEPLMFVDRIMVLEGRPRSMEGGRIVTEHDVRPGAWYLDGDRVAPCVAMEAGQADLVLSGYLGVDFVTRGRSLYRLLDANVTFHRGLPVVGDVLRYDIRITQFFRQGTTVLFRFEYDATVGGEPLITMRDGCAGFFTAEELAAGKGVSPARIASRKRPSVKSVEADLVPSSPSRLDEPAVEALRRGDLATAFGRPFGGLSLSDPPALPGGLMSMIRRVPSLEPTGGPNGLGFIRAEADIRPGDWYMVCHFIDDRVMPGTLMYECCLHAMRILLMRLGWVGDREVAAFEPVPGVANRLRCRGQITEATRTVAYEVTIKERGYRPEPYAIADALIVADGKPIVSVTDLALQLTGMDREGLHRLWGKSGVGTAHRGTP